MDIEYEIKVLEKEKERILELLENLNANKVEKFNQKKTVYDINQIKEGKWLKLRTNKKFFDLTYKDIVSNTIDGTEELEIIVNDFNKTKKLLEYISYIFRNYKDNIIIQYTLNGVKVDIDLCKKIPAYLEIEGKSEDEVMNIFDVLGLNNNNVIALNCNCIKEIYNIDNFKIKKFKLNNNTKIIAK